MQRVILVGNPNCGKTTLFNALTGQHQRIGNWAGVTVAAKTSSLVLRETTVELVDLPGIYSLSEGGHVVDGSDAAITAQTVHDTSFDLMVYIMDASRFERHAYLMSQLLELGKPMIVVLNMMDLAESKGLVIDQVALAHRLGCPVIAMKAHQQLGVDALKIAIESMPALPIPLSLVFQPMLQPMIQAQIEALQVGQVKSVTQARFLAYRQLEGGVLSDHTLTTFSDVDMLMADARYQAVHALVQQVQHQEKQVRQGLTAFIDKIVLHRVWALPIFLLVMYGLFFFAVNVGGVFQDFFDLASDALFVQASASGLQWLHAPAWLVAIISNGIGRGLNTTLTFIPVLTAMFFGLAVLEYSGYMARAAFVVDKIMRFLGLSGKAFVPMIVGFGCNVPAVMAARSMDSLRDRLLTVMMSPYMSCSARLAIYAIFVSAFFPEGGAVVIFSLYMIGILMAVLTGLFLRRTLFLKQAAPLLLELPVYHWPGFRRLCRETGRRLRQFIVRAGKVIVPACVLLGSLHAMTMTGQMVDATGSAGSLLSLLAKKIGFLFAPMGISPDNWPATVGLLTGFIAKEVVIGTLHTLYAQVDHFNVAVTSMTALQQSFAMAWHSIPENISNLVSALGNPFAASTPWQSSSLPLAHALARHFDGQAGAYAYLLFILLYVPCISTVAAIRQEAGAPLMWFSIIWSFLVAYGVSVLFYQLATWRLHPEQTIGWIVVFGSVGVLLSLGLMRSQGGWRAFGRA